MGYGKKLSEVCPTLLLGPTFLPCPSDEGWGGPFLFPSCSLGHSLWGTNWVTLYFPPCSWITLKKNKPEKTWKWEGMVPHLVYSDCMFEDQDEESTQVPQLHKNCPASAHFWALAYVSRSWGKVAVFHQSTLSFHCVFNELCPGFCLQVSSQKTGCAITKA